MREARVRLARTAATPDVDWQVGVRRLQEGGDMALVFCTHWFDIVRSDCTRVIGLRDGRIAGVGKAGSVGGVECPGPACV